MDRTDDQAAHGAWWKRLGWLVLIWALSVGALGIVALGLKLVMRLAGLTT